MKLMIVLFVLILINCCPYIITINEHGMKETPYYRKIEHIDTIKSKNVIRFYHWEREECHSNQ